MNISYTVADTIAHINRFKSSGTSIGLIPTMGALHKGHMALIDACKRTSEVCVCSIFVNPLQFDQQSDFEKYPRTLSQDINMLENAGCDLLFAPSASEIYAKPSTLKIHFEYQNRVMEGRFRKGHFNGVGIVVAKLFNIVKPNAAFFGQKDFQQTLIVRQLIDSLSFDIQLYVVPTIREADGLAMSSRNSRLTSSQRTRALAIYQSLKYAEKYIPVQNLSQVLTNAIKIQSDAGIRTEYMQVANVSTGKIVNKIKPKNSYAICTAAWLDETRLIDNIILNT